MCCFLLCSCMACVHIVLNQGIISKIKRQLDRRICRTVIFRMVLFYAEGSYFKGRQERYLAHKTGSKLTPNSASLVQTTSSYSLILTSVLSQHHHPCGFSYARCQPITMCVFLKSHACQTLR